MQDAAVLGDPTTQRQRLSRIPYGDHPLELERYSKDLEHDSPWDQPLKLERYRKSEHSPKIPPPPREPYPWRQWRRSLIPDYKNATEVLPKWPRSAHSNPKVSPKCPGIEKRISKRAPECKDMFPNRQIIPKGDSTHEKVCLPSLFVLHPLRRTARSTLNNTTLYCCFVVAETVQ